jgi:serine/threonine-protein kinase
MTTTVPGHHEATEQYLPEAGVGNRIGPYRLLKLLGEGSTGRVFEVEHEKIARRAALKLLAAQHASSPSAVKRLFTEALAVNRINNPHIVEITDLVEAGEHQILVDGQESVSSLPVNALVMELLEGQSLQQAMIGEGPMPPERFLRIMAQVCQALAAAHAAGFIHRDLKPDNIFLTKRGNQDDFVKLLDFGLAKVINVDLSLLQNPALTTLDGSFVGTPGYVSPEQAAGKRVDHRTDIYGVGVILYELVCGRLPFEGTSLGDFLIHHITTPPPHLPDEILATRLGHALDGIIQRCLDKDPAARFSSAAQLAEIFEGLARGDDVQFTPVGSYARAWKPPPAAWQRSLTRVGIGLSAGVLLSIAGGLVMSRGRHEPVPGAGAPVAAAAAAPPAGVAPAPALPVEVKLSFESDPPGAEARIVGQAQPLGTTPFQRAFRRSDQPLQIELRRAGYEPLHVATTAEVSRTVNVTLTRAAPRAAAPSPAHGPSPGGRRAARGVHTPVARAQGDREATLNPFH